VESFSVKFTIPHIDFERNKVDTVFMSEKYCILRLIASLKLRRFKGNTEVAHLGSRKGFSEFF